MRRKLLYAGIGAALALVCGCDHADVTTTAPTGAIVGSGVIASEARPVSGFAAVTVAGPIRLVLAQTGAESLEITAEDNVLPLVHSEVRGGRLFLGFAPRTSLSHTRDVVCRVTAAELRDLEASGGSSVEMDGIEVARLGIHLSGAATGSASGTVDALALDVSGASRWSGGELRSRVVSADVSGASYGLVRARESLVANVSGASVLEYVGDPAVVPTVTGVSVLRRIGN
jgi:hypothetical protein